MRMRRWLMTLSCCVLSLGSVCRENAESTYPDRQAAERADAIRHGWIPSFLPSKATDIHEAHSIDTNMSWGAFAFDTKDREWEASLSAVSTDQISRHSMWIPTRPSWWEKNLDKDLRADWFDRAGFKLYIVEGGRTVVAVDWTHGRAYFRSKPQS